MAKLRKMLGHADDPEIIALMRLIETQSKTTLVNWSLSYARDHFLPIYEAFNSEDRRPEAALNATSGWLDKQVKLPDVKNAVREATNAAKEAEGHPAAQAAARGISVAAATIYSPTGALGMTFYGAAAIAYHREGLEQPAEIYDQIAHEELNKMLEALQAVAITDEPNPVKINWNC